jgi:hypothetical protein
MACFMEGICSRAVKCVASASHKQRKSFFFLRLLRIKLGKMESFVKTMNNDGNEFSYLNHRFPRISEVKIKGGIFIDPQITKFMQDSTTEATLNPIERAAWNY